MTGKRKRQREHGMEVAATFGWIDENDEVKRSDGRQDVGDC